MHPRSEIRRGLIAAVARVDVFGGRVKGTRIDPISIDDGACATIMTIDETSDVDTTERRKRDPRFQVTAIIAAGTDPDQALDDLVAAIEAEIGADVDLRRLCKPLVLVETRFDFRNEDKQGQPLERPVARVGLIYRATYRTNAVGASG